MTENRAEDVNEIAPSPPSRVYYPALDTLRGFFAVSVILFHFYLQQIQIVPVDRRNELFTMGGMGAFGVPFFFVLSSFLITDLLLEEKMRTGGLAILPFYGRRILRIWPVYFAAVFLGIYVVDHLAGLSGTGVWLVPFSFFFANNVIAGQTIGSAPMTYAPLWSVSIEEQFYFLWPWVMRFVKPKFLPAVGVTLIVAALLSRDWRADLVGNHHVNIWFHTSSHLDSFGFGILACHLHRKGYGKRLKPYLGWIAGGVVVFLIGLQQGTGTLLREPNLTPAGLYLYSLVPLSASILILACAQPAEDLGRFWKHPVGLWFGRLSYGIYVYHGFAIQLTMNSISPSRRAIAVRFLTVIGITMGCAVASYYGLERPALSLKGRFQRVASGAA